MDDARKAYEELVDVHKAYKDLVGEKIRDCVASVEGNVSALLKLNLGFSSCIEENRIDTLGISVVRGNFLT